MVYSSCVSQPLICHAGTDPASELYGDWTPMHVGFYYRRKVLTVSWSAFSPSTSLSPVFVLTIKHRGILWSQNITGNLIITMQTVYDVNKCNRRFGRNHIWYKISVHFLVMWKHSGLHCKAGADLASQLYWLLVHSFSKVLVMCRLYQLSSLLLSAFSHNAHATTK